MPPYSNHHRASLSVLELLRGRRRGKGMEPDSEARHQGDLCRDERRWSDAAVWYRQHVDEHPEDFGIWVQLGNCLKEAGAYGDALTAYWRAIAIDGDDADVFLQLGHLQKLMGRPGDAAAAYRTSLARQPADNPAAHELSVMGQEPAEVAVGPRTNGIAHRLSAIEKRLGQLIEAGTAQPLHSNTDTQHQVGDSSTAQLTVVRPPTAMMMARGHRQTTLLVIGSTAESKETASDFLKGLLQAMVCLGNTVRIVQWNLDLRAFELLNRVDLDRLGLSVIVGEAASTYPETADSKVVIERLSCSKEDWLLCAEPIRVPKTDYLIEAEMVVAAKKLGVLSSFIFHGADPLRLGRCAGSEAASCEQYMQALLLADVVMPVSTVALNDLKAFFVQHQRARLGPTITRILPPTMELAEDRGAWSIYARRIRATLASFAYDRSRSISMYYLVGAAADDEGCLLLASALSRHGVRMIAASWNADEKKLVAAEKVIRDTTSAFSTSVAWDTWIEPGEPNVPNWLVLPHAVDADLVANLLVFAKEKGLRVTAVLNDKDCYSESRDDQRLFEVLIGADKVLATSERRYQDLYGFLLAWRGKVHSAEHRFRIVPAPSQLPDYARRFVPRMSSGGVRVVILLSSRNLSGLVTVLDAVAEAERHFGNQMSVTVVGVPDGKANELEAIESKIAQLHTVTWVQVCDDERRGLILGQSDFAIAIGSDGSDARLVTECLWRGLPCLGHRDSLVEGGQPGLMFADLLNFDEVLVSISKLLDRDWRASLAHEAVNRSFHCWADYAREIIAELATDRLVDQLQIVDNSPKRDVYATLVNLKRRPKLSLCISTYNRAGWLEVSLRNIFSQIVTPRHDLEVLVVDNTSTDRTSEVVKPYLQRPDFRYCRNLKNVGMLGNLAVTAQRARGDYIWILGDDDLTRPGAIERVLHVLETHRDLALVYLNYGYTTEVNPANVTDLDAFLAEFNQLEPAGPDELAPVKRLVAKCENFFGAIYSHVYRRDHGLRSYCQDTSGRIFSTMQSCIPTTYYVLNYMADEPAFWIGEPLLVVNSNVSWQDYGVLLELEQLPRSWDLAERVGADSAEVDRRRANRLWLVEMMWREIFDNDRVGNSAYFSAPRALMRIKHLPEFEKHVPEFARIYEKAFSLGHPAATMSTRELFRAYSANLPVSLQ